MTYFDNNSIDLMKKYKELEFIIDKSPVIVFLWKNEEKWPVEFVSENISQFGYTQDEFITGKIQYAEIIHPEDLDRVAKEIRIHSENDLSEFTQEYRIFNKSNEVIWVDDRTFIRRDSESNITHFQGVILDITEKKRIQEELEDSERKFRMISEQILVGIGILQDGKVVYANKKAVDIFGYSIDEMKHWSAGGFAITIHPEDLERELKHIDQIQNNPNVNEVQFQTRGLKKTGELFWAEALFKKFIYNNRPALIGIFIDITERKKIENDLRFTQFSLEHSAETAFWMDSTAKLIYVNEAACKSLVYSREELLNMYIYDLDPDFPKEAWKAHWEEIKEKGSYILESRHQKKNGEIIPVEISVNYLEFENKEYNCVFARDISERIEAERELKESEEKYRVLFEQAADSIFLVDIETRNILDFNQKLLDTLGYTREEFRKLRIPDFDLREDKQEFHAHFDKILKNGYDVFETKYITKNGGIRNILVSARLIKLKSKSFIQTVSHDITDIKEAEKKVQESEEKYREAFYRENFYKDLFLHDMRNILQAISSSLEIYEYKLKDDMTRTQSRKDLVRIYTQIERGAHLINNIKKFSELESIKHSLIKQNFYQIIKKSVSIVQNSLKSKKMHIKLEPKEDPAFLIWGNELIYEVIENILVNSTIHNDNEEIEISIFISNVLKDQKPYIRVEISDNARGIEDSRKNIVFNRAYNQDTSKIGMGLGLSLIKIIIENFDGYIWIEDKIPRDYKKGCKFVILIPKVE